MSAEQKLAGVYVKIERAKHHVADLQNAVKTFIASNPYKLVPYKDPNSGKDGFQVSSIVSIPNPIISITGDAIQNMRSALDHLANQLVLMVPGANPDHEFNFPFHNTAKQHKTFLDGKIKTLRKDAIEAFRALEPYKGGAGHPLWVLNRLNNIDKHRLLITAAMGWYQDIGMDDYLKASGFNLLGFGKGFFMQSPNPVICPLKTGDILFPAKDNLGNDLHLRADVSFYEPKVLKSKSLLETIQEFVNLVSGVVTSFKPCLV